VTKSNQYNSGSGGWHANDIARDKARLHRVIVEPIRLLLYLASITIGTYSREKITEVFPRRLLE